MQQTPPLAVEFFFENMQFQFYKIPVNNSQPQTDEMNAFLRGHKIVSVEKHFAANEHNAYWAFCVQYILGIPKQSVSTKKEKTDYKDILDEKTFAIFSELRKIRKQLATEDAVPAYAVFTDAELAEISKLKELTTAALKTITGIGEKKIEKYGRLMLEEYKKIINNETAS